MDDADDSAELDDGEVHRFVVDITHEGERIDAAIAALIAISRATARRLIDDELVLLNGRPATKAGARLKTGDELAVTVPPPVAIELVPEDIPLSIAYEDAELIVIDKPAGLVVHPAAGHPRGTLVNALLHHCRDLQGIGGELRPGIVHRLDKGTSGLIVVAKTERAHTALTAAFAAKSRGQRGQRGAEGRDNRREDLGIEREYLGIAAPPPTHAGGTIRTLYGRHPTDRKRFSSKVTSGKSAVTHWQLVEKLGAAALLRFRLETGRTHQIRVHAADSGWPLLGDSMYGRAPKPLAAVAETLGRQALHAATLAFDHPVTGERIARTSPLPADFEAALTALR